MNISDVVYATLDEVATMPRFDMNEMPRKPRWFLRPIAWLLSFPETFKYHAKINKHGVKGLKPPYIMLCNHNSFFDFKVATRAIFPHIANNIVAIDGFINREELLRNVGCVLKRKFVPDAPLIKKIKHTLLVNKGISGIYPEARYSLSGTNAILPDSLGKMVKLLNYPVVTFICHGHHLQQPVWNLKKRKVKTSADMTLILDKSTIASKSIEAINHIIHKAFIYDDYKYQVEHKLHIKEPWRAEGLHKILYQCPHCLAEGKMTSKLDKLTCTECGQVYVMDELGQLSAPAGETKFRHIPDWYEWERAQVREQIKSGNYKTEADVHVDILQNSTGFYRLGVARLTHDAMGFNLEAIWDGHPFKVEKYPLENYSIHIEYEYFQKGDGISISTLQDTYYLYDVEQKICVTKIHFAVEELYKIKVEEASIHAKKTKQKTAPQIQTSTKG
ncbi:MAG TPA: hypothetical protein DCX17_02170 [Firmicutes bacterium]|nr:hypothetical protein [Bacillota bacterium]